MITFVTSFSQRYYEEVAQYSLPTWKFLLGRKIVLVDGNFNPKLENIEIINSDIAFNKDDPYFQTTGKKFKFWRKGMCFAWAAENIDSDYIVWLDSDVKLFKEPDFEKFKPNENVLATMISADLSHAETGFVFLNKKHPDFKKWLAEYKTGWYNGLIDKIPRPWDGYMFYETIKNYPHINLAKNTVKGPQGFEDTDLLEYMFHYSGKHRKNMIKDSQ